MRMEKIIKNYFLNTDIEDWNYDDFNKYLRLLGYRKEEDIFRIYTKIMKDFVDYTVDENEQNSNEKMNSTDSARTSKRVVIKFLIIIIIYKNISCYIVDSNNLLIFCKFYTSTKYIGLIAAYISIF